MKTLGLCLPKDRSEAMAPCPTTPEEFGPDSLANKKDQGNDTLNTDDPVESSISSNSQESYKKFGLDSGLSNCFKSDNGLCNGFTNVHEATRDIILPTTKLKSREDLQPTATAPSLSQNASHTLFDKPSEVKLSAINHTISKPIPSRCGKLSKRPSLEYLVARLHNRVEETKNSIGCIQRKDTHLNSPLSSKDIGDNKTDRHLFGERLNLVEEKSPIPSSSQLVEKKTIAAFTTVKEKVDVKDNVNHTTSVINESYAVKFTHKCDSANKSQNLCNISEACSTFAQSFSTDHLKCKDNVHISCTKHSSNEDSATENKLSHSIGGGSYFVDFSYPFNKVSSSQDKIHPNTSDNEDCTGILKNQNLMKLGVKETCEKSTVVTEYSSKSTENVHSEESNSKLQFDKSVEVVDCMKSNVTSNSKAPLSNQISYDDDNNLGASTDTDKHLGTLDSAKKIEIEKDLSQILSKYKETSDEVFHEMTVQEYSENTLTEVVGAKLVIDTCELLKKSDDVVEVSGEKIIEETNEKSEEDFCKKANDNLYEKSSSTSTTPMFSDTLSDASQSEMMVRISDAVAALLENTKGKHSNDANESYKDEMKDDSPNKLFSNSNSPIGGSKNDINFSSAFRILDLLQETSENKSDTKASELHDGRFELLEKRENAEIKDSINSILSSTGPLPHLFKKDSDNTIESVSYSTSVEDSHHLTSEGEESENVERKLVGRKSINDCAKSIHFGEALNDIVSRPCRDAQNEGSEHESIINSVERNIVLSKSVQDEPMNSENEDVNIANPKLCSEGTSLLARSCKEMHESFNTSPAETTHSNFTEEQDSKFPEVFQREIERNTGKELDRSVPLSSANLTFENAELDCSTMESLLINVNSLALSSSHVKKDVLQCDHPSKRDLIGNYVTEKVPSTLSLHSFEIMTKKYIDKVLNKECNYYCSQLKMKHLNFSFASNLSHSICLDPTSDLVNCSKSNCSVNIPSNFSKVGFTEEVLQNCENKSSVGLVADECQERHNKEIKEQSLVESVEDSPIDCIRDQNISTVESHCIDLGGNSSQAIEDFTSSFQGESADIKEESVINILEEDEDAEEREKQQSKEVSAEESLHKALKEEEEEEGEECECTLLEIHSSNIDLLHPNSFNEIPSAKYSFLDFLKQDRPLVAGECILCKSSYHEDLCWHASQLHTCISYTPIYQTAAFIHHMRERIGFVTHAYNDDAYGNPLYICKCCSSLFKTMDSVRIHLNSHKEVYMIHSSSQTCKCNKSYFSFPDQKWRVLLFQSEFVCSFCSYLFGCQNGLVNHLKVVHFHGKYCHECKYELDLENDLNLIEHNAHHCLSKEKDCVFSYGENIEPEKDQTHFSWNSLDNHLNYLDGKVFRLDALKDLNKRQDRKYLTLPMTVDPSYATVPEGMALSPAPEMTTYIKFKLDSKLTGREVDEYASKVLDLPVQIMLQKKFSTKKKKKGRHSLSKRAKVPLPLYLELHSNLLKGRRYIALSYQDDNSALPPRCMYARKAKTKNQKKHLVRNKQLNVSEENLLKPSRTRSGITPRGTSENEEGQPSMLSTHTQNITNEVTGEWVNYHTYVCCACGAVFLDLAEIMDHKWEAHPGVWCAHTMIQGQEKVPKMFYQQYLPAHSRNSYLDNSASGSKFTKQKEKEKFICTYCKMKFGNREALHFHIIDCGGLNQIVTSKKKNKKGIRFKRRKGQGIPSRRYAFHSLAPTPQKNTSDRGSGMSTPNKENSPHVTASSSSNIVKRRLELAIGSIENSKLKSKLEAILFKRRTSPIEFSQSKKRNLRRRLRKKKLYQKRTRITRHSEVRKESKKSAKEGKKLDPVDKKKTKKDADSESSANRKLGNGKKQPIASKKEARKIPMLKKKSSMGSSKDDNTEPVKQEFKTTKKGSSIVSIEKKFKKLVPLAKGALVKQKLQPSKEIVATANQDNKGSGGKRSLEKLKNAQQSKTAPKFIKKVKNTVLKKRKGKVSKCAKSGFRATQPKRAVHKNASLAKRASAATSEQSDATERKDESDSASEPEVIRNFRRKRLIGRTGLRTRKNQATRYSLRPSVSVAKDDDRVSETVQDDDDDEDDVIGKPRRLFRRRYNIGDDDDDAAEESKMLVSSDVEDSALNSVAKSKPGSKPVSRRGSEDTEDAPKTEDPLPVNEIEKPQNPSCKKSLSSFKNPKSNMSRLYYMAQKNLGRLKVSCQNTDSESSSGFEGFSSYSKRRKNSLLKVTSTLCSSESRVGISSKPEVKEPAFGPALQTSSVTMEKSDSAKQETTARVGKRRLSRKSSKPKKRKIILTPEIVMSDTESDVPPQEPEEADASSHSEREKSKNQDGDLTHANSVLLETADVSKSIPTAVALNESGNKRKKKNIGNYKRKRSKVSVTDQKEIDKTEPDVGDPGNVPSSKDIQAVNDSSIKSKLKPKRKYTFKKKLLNDSATDKPRNKKILKEVSVLSYKSLNTKETPLSLEKKDEKRLSKCEEVIAHELEKPKKKRPYRKRIRSNVDENSPTVAKSTKKYKKLKVSPKLGKRSDEIETEPIGFLCIDCGLSFDSALSREDHRQDCRNIAFEMSLMAEDHLYECPYCQLTFALRGTQRKHIASCRMSRSRKYANRRKRQATTGSQRSSVKGSKSPRVPSACHEGAFGPPPTPCDGMHPPEESKEAENIANSAIGEIEEPEMELMGSRLASYCEEFVGVKEVCALMTEYKFCTNDLRCLLTTSASSRDSTTVISFNSGNSPSPSSVYQNSNYETLQSLLKQTACLGLTLVFSNALQALLEKENEDGLAKDSASPDSNIIRLDITRPELLKALSSVEELLKEVSNFDSFLKKEQMLLAMKQTFQADTGS